MLALTNAITFNPIYKNVLGSVTAQDVKGTSTYLLGRYVPKYINISKEL